jgi:hypothetical protein
MENKITEWNEILDKYFLSNIECINNINLINNMRNDLLKLLSHQDKDNIIFYKCIINNSYFYLSNSLKIREIKFLKDLNKINCKINENKKIINLNKYEIDLIIMDFKKLNDEILEAKKNNTIFKWVKDDITENLQDIENNITDTLNYHLKLINILLTFIKLETNFYCNST